MAKTTTEIYRETLAGRVFLQVDQAEPEDQELSWHQQERRDDSDLGCAHHPSHDCLLQVPGEVKLELLTNTDVSSSEYICSKESKGVI